MLHPSMLLSDSHQPQGHGVSVLGVLPNLASISDRYNVGEIAVVRYIVYLEIDVQKFWRLTFGYC